MTDLRETSVGVAGEPGNGPFIRFMCQLESGTVVSCQPEANGCLWAISIADTCVKLAINRSVEQALLIEPRDIDLVLGGIPEGKGHYAEMAVIALRAALTNFTPDSRRLGPDSSNLKT